MYRKKFDFLFAEIFSSSISSTETDFYLSDWKMSWSQYLTFASYVPCAPSSGHKRKISSPFVRPSSTATENLHLYWRNTQNSPVTPRVASIANLYSQHDLTSHDHAVWIQIRNASKVRDVVLPPHNSQRTWNFFGAPRLDNTFLSKFETSRSAKGGQWDTIAVKRDLFSSSIDSRLLFRESLSNSSLKSVRTVYF